MTTGRQKPAKQEPGAGGPGYAWTWKAGPVAGPALSAGGALSLAMAGDLAGVAPWWAVGTGALAAVVAGARDAVHGVSRGGAAYRAACWAGAGAWGAWALAGTPWSADTLAGLAGGAVVAGLAAPGMARRERRIVAQRAEAVTRQEQIDLCVEWEQRIHRVCGMAGVVIDGLAPWESGYGYTLRARLPKDGTTSAVLMAKTKNLAADAGLPAACTIEILPGQTQDTVMIRVNTQPLPDEIGYPSDWAPLSFTRAVPLGLYRTGAVSGVELLEDPLLVVGRRGSGKTNLLQALNLSLLRCPDVLVWHIDLNGAGMSRPWQQPWLSGSSDRPVIDWVASTVEEAKLMLQTALAIGHRRKVTGAAAMDQVDDDKLPISPRTPAIVIVMDEGAEALALNRGARDLQVLAEQVISQLRAARVQIVVSALRATADIIPAPVKAQAGSKVFMAPEDLHEVAQLLGWKSGMPIPDVSRPGHALMRATGYSAGAMQAWRVLPSQIRQAVPVLQVLRAGTALEPAAVEAGGQAYAGRHDRYLAWYQGQGGQTTATAPAPAPVPAAGSGGAGSIPPLPPPMSPEQALAAAAEASRRAQERIAEVQATRRFADLATQLGDVAELGEQILRAEQGAPAQPAGDQTPAQAQGRPQTPGVPGQQTSAAPPADGPAVMLEILRGVEQGMHWEQLLTALETQGVPVAKATLYRWLRDAETRGEAHSPTRGWWAPGTPSS